MGDQLSCTYQLMGRQKVDKKKYIKPTQSLPNIISRTQNTDTHTKNYARQAQHTGNMCYGGFSLWQVQTDCSELRDKYWKKTLKTCSKTARFTLYHNRDRSLFLLVKMCMELNPDIKLKKKKQEDRKSTSF